MRRGGLGEGSEVESGGGGGELRGTRLVGTDEGGKVEEDERFRGTSRGG